jgi:hypothetical protein
MITPGEETNPNQVVGAPPAIVGSGLGEPKKSKKLLFLIVAVVAI